MGRAQVGIRPFGGVPLLWRRVHFRVGCRTVARPVVTAGLLPDASVKSYLTRNTSGFNECHSGQALFYRKTHGSFKTD